MKSEHGATSDSKTKKNKAFHPELHFKNSHRLQVVHKKRCHDSKNKNNHNPRRQSKNVVVEERMKAKILGVMDVTLFHILATLPNLGTTFGYQSVFCLEFHSKRDGANQIFNLIREKRLNEKTLKLMLVSAIFEKHVEKQVRPSLPDVFRDLCIPTELTQLVK